MGNEIEKGNFKLNIGINIKDEKRDLTITDGYYKNKKHKSRTRNEKWYKYTCNKCGWTKGEVYEGNLLRGVGCACCANHKTVLGINTIWDTDRWMCDLGVSEEDAKCHTRSSNKKINVRCIDCGKVKNMIIGSIYKYKSIRCCCGDGKSYPEKFVMSILDQINMEYETEHRPEWANNKRYDFYIKLKSSIIETHGSQHPGTKYYKRNSFQKTCENDKQELENDIYKEKLAKENGIENYIIIDCSLSDMDFIKENILNSKLAELYDLSNINWLGCEKFALSNRAKEVCDYWNNKEDWETVLDVADIFNLHNTTIIRYLKNGTKLGWCRYISCEEIKKNYLRLQNRNKKYFSKQVEVYKDGISLGVFESVAELSRQSKEVLGIKMLVSRISAVCRGERKHHYGYVFKYVEN